MSTEHPILADASVPHNRAVEVARPRATLRTHALEIVLFAASIALLGWTGFAVARAAVGATAPTGDLTFSGTLDELELVLSNGGPDRLARLDEATLASAGGGAIVVDTIALLADAADEPAAAPGGFIADQVALFNDHAIREAVLRATMRAARPARATTVPSLLRTVRADDGERRLSGHVNPFVLTVRSPYAERTWREVRTADWSSSASLLGIAGDVALSPRTPDGSLARLNGQDCTIRREAGAGEQIDPAGHFLLYCGSTLASGVGRFYDIGFELNGAGRPFSPARAFLYRPADVWRNGETHSFTESAVGAGEVFDVRRAGPFLLSVSERGTLAAGQWINGRPSFANQQLGTISFFAAAGRTAGGTPSGTPLVLMLDAALSADLETEARRFVAARPALRRMSVVLMDARTGAVRAIVEPARRSGAEPLLAFEPLLVGSVVKPLVATAILARQPRLGDLSVAWAGDTVRVVANVPLDNGFANAANGCAAGIAFRDFIRCSSNQYAAELLVRSLRADGFEIASAGRTADGHLFVPRDVLERSAIGDGLAEAFDVDALAGRTAGRTPGLWAAMSATGADDRTLMPWASRPWLLFPGTDGTRLDLLARYAFGGWENRWTPLGLAEAYARIATGREVKARIIEEPARGVDGPASILDGSALTDSARTAYDTEQADAMSSHVAQAFQRVRAALREVPTAGTAAGIAAELQKAVGDDVVVLAKTGTLNERRDRFRSLVIALGTPAAAETSAPLTCGLVAVTWFDFHDDGRRGAARLAPVHLEFARGGFADVLQRHWRRVSGCATGASP